MKNAPALFGKPPGTETTPVLILTLSGSRLQAALNGQPGSAKDKDALCKGTSSAGLSGFRLCRLGRQRGKALLGSVLENYYIFFEINQLFKINTIEI